MMRPLLVISVLASGCAREREQAPRALDDVVHALFRDWSDEDAMVEHTLALTDWLERRGDSDAAWDGLRLSNLTADDVHDVDDAPGTDLSLHAGLATAAVSDFYVGDHAELLVETDQTWTDPSSFLVYDRRIIGGDERSFLDGEGAVHTDNVIEKRTIGITIPYTVRKDYRWIPAPTPALVGRTWLTEAGCSDNGKNCVNQSFGVDVFIGDGQDTRRLYAVWLEVVSVADSLLDEDQKIAMIAKGNQSILEATDAELALR